MIRKLKSGKYRLYSRKKNPKTGKRRNLGTFNTREAAKNTNAPCSTSNAIDGSTARAFAQPKAKVGEQHERIHDARVWVLPNPSGLNANYQLPELVKLFRELREAAAVSQPPR